MPIPNEVHPERGGSIDPADPRWQLVERIVASPCFQKSERLKAFLKHVAQQHLAGHSEALTGLEIGKAVFGKDDYYDQSEDNTVRIHARQLRLRLLEYFDTYGHNEPLLLEIPKGAYIPVFRDNPAHVEAPAALVSSPITPQGIHTIVPPPKSPALLQWIPWALVACLVIAICILVLRTRTPAQLSVLSGSGIELWPLSDLIAHGEEAQVVLSDNNYALFSAVAQRRFHLSDYLNPEYPMNLYPQMKSIHDIGLSVLFDQLRRKQLTAYSDSATVAMIMQLGRGGAWSIRPARNLNLRDLQNGNYLLLGSSWTNPWVELYEPRLNFVVTDRFPLAILNRHPLPGEKPAYFTEGQTGDVGDDYAAIAMIPNEKRGTVMILQGIKEEGTEAAGLFIASAKGRRALREKLGIGEGDLGRTFFEAVVRTSTFEGASTQTQIVTARRLGAAARP